MPTPSSDDKSIKIGTSVYYGDYKNIFKVAAIYKYKGLADINDPLEEFSIYGVYVGHLRRL